MLTRVIISILPGPAGAEGDGQHLEAEAPPDVAVFQGDTGAQAQGLPLEILGGAVDYQFCAMYGYARCDM